MKNKKAFQVFVASILALGTLAACSGESTRAMPPGAIARIDLQTVAFDVSRDDGFQPGEQIWYDQVSGKYARAGIHKATGYGYKYYPNRELFVEVPNGGSAGTMCATSSVTGKKSCLITTGLNGISFQMGTSGVAQVCVISHDFPGRTARMRIDSGRIFTTGESGCLRGSAARTLVAEARRGNELNADYVEWPYNVRKETTAKVGAGLHVALELWSFLHGRSVQSSLFVVDQSEAHKQDIVRRKGM